MSTSSILVGGRDSDAVAPRPAVRLSPSLRLFRSELRLVLRRRRNIALVAVLCCFPVLIGVAVRLSAPSDGDGPPFLSQVTDNGLFLVFTSLTVLLPFFLPLSVSVASGEAIAGEANIGTLRNLLVVPVSRTRLLLVKFAGVGGVRLCVHFRGGRGRCDRRAAALPARRRDAVVGLDGVLCGRAVAGAARRPAM